MRWMMLPILVLGLVCSVLSASNGEQSLKILVRSTVFNISEKKGLYCEGSNIGTDEMEWLAPDGTVVERRTNRNARVFVEKRDPNLLVLIIRNVTMQDSGNWTCKAKEGDLLDTLDAIVGEKATVDAENEEKQEDENRNTKLFCRTKGIPPPVVQWYKENENIDEMMQRDEMFAKKYVMSNKRDLYSLEIKRLNHADAGLYLCKVTQKSLSHYMSKKINLIVHPLQSLDATNERPESLEDKPIPFDSETQEILVGPKAREMELYAVLNETKPITCSMLAFPAPTFTWYRHKSSFDQPIQDLEMISSPSVHSSTLTLRMRDMDDFGEYKCKAENEKGLFATIFHVNLGERPMAPDTVSFVNANDSFITFSVGCSNCTFKTDESTTPDPKNLPVIKYTFQLTPHAEGYAPDWEHNLNFTLDIIDPLANTTTFDVGPLANSTTYHVRVRSVNSAGFSDWLDMPELPTTTDHAVRLGVTLLLMVAALLVTMLF